MISTRGAGLSCRYGVNTPALENMVGRLLQMYKERPVTMIKMVYEQAKDPLRAFADAFRIRKEDSVEGLFYLLCAATALTCSVLLFRGFRRSGTRLLLWCALFFLSLPWKT